MPARLGLNCALSYARGGVIHRYRVRAGAIAHGVSMIAVESAARTFRAYYPHRPARQAFSVIVLLKDWDERRDFTTWLATYAAFAIDPDLQQDFFPWMTVSIPSREFAGQGVPVQGYQWGAHTGQMMFAPQVVFEAATSPWQNGLPHLSRVINKWEAFASDKAVQYFYPIGTQLSGNQQGNFSKIIYPGNPEQFNGPSQPAPGGPPHPAGG
jgi:hypothetical protein